MVTIKRAAKYGFCSGVRIADLKVKRFAAKGGTGAILGQVVHNDRRCRFQLIEHRPDRRSHGVRCRPCHRAQVRALGYDRQGTKVVAILHVEAQGVGERRQHLR